MAKIANIIVTNVIDTAAFALCEETDEEVFISGSIAEVMDLQEMDPQI